MEISKSTIKQELIRILDKVFQLPEVDKVVIRDIEICASDGYEERSSLFFEIWKEYEAKLE